MAAAKKKDGADGLEPVIENRRARHDYAIEETLECGIELRGTEVKSVRHGHASLAEGWVLAEDEPPKLSLQNVHIAEYPPAGAHRQHEPNRPRRLLAHKREIRRLAVEIRARGASLVPLKMYFLRGKVKLLVGLAIGRKKVDKRQAIAAKEARRDIERETSRRRFDR
jgi:SsrA-binding protein